METFIVRLWTPSPDLADDLAEGELHGSVEHIRARESYRFQSGDCLLEILRLALDAPREGPLGDGRASSQD